MKGNMYAYEEPKKSLFFNVKWAVSAAAVFALTVLVLSEIGFIPEPVKTLASSEPAPVETVVPAFQGDPVPARILIEKIGVDQPIQNPESKDIAVLDAALLKGVARYPGSADLEEAGNMFLFGHSSGRPVIYNPAFKAFNRIGELTAGDIIKVQSSDAENRYRVTSVTIAEAAEISVPLANTGRMLTLSTCNSFGEKSERVVVKAEYVETVMKTASN